MSWKTHVEQGVATLTLDAPPLNILTRAVLAELRTVLATLEATPELRAVRLTAAGRHFSAGADVGEHLPPQYEELIPEFCDTIERLARLPLPVIAAVRGRCLGGGFELAMAADVIVAGEGATFGQPEIVLGVTAPVACVILPRLSQHGFAAELLFAGDAVSSTRARAAGVVQHVVPDETVEDEALAIARRIARHSAAALRATKATLLDSAVKPLGEALRAASDDYVTKLMKTEDALEGLNAFLEKRPAQWRHR
ncbi:MAG: enoyl-CoA hydratase/isomerase family protein [Candidatus Eisenbacteria bacterium]|uniref:Enoyl-CoA hydratase/isomerase family protein n=1 Tax=Eiseniibacteriota bacterium TaxID=2212470 RepID=A0A933SB12_UNCEI|nr:enoyl-CoA hydratase/isomerase family protein [Candidatus Eisenbacteria bacterium]